MYLEDLLDSEPGKDLSKSCIFDFPDRPPDQLPPDYPPISPPTCYPYCTPDDWPPPPIPPVPVIPPGAIHHDPGIAWIDIAGRVQCPFINNPNPARVAAQPNFFLKVDITGLGFLGSLTATPRSAPPVVNTYLGGAANAGDYILNYTDDFFTSGFNSIGVREFFLDYQKLLLDPLYFSITLFQVSIRQGVIFDAGDTLIFAGVETTQAEDTGSENSVNYTYNLNSIFQPLLEIDWYISRSAGLYSYATQAGVQIFPTIVTP